MREFDKFFSTMKEKYPLYQDKDGYNIGNYGALKIGWKEALRFVLSLKQTPESVAILIERIEKELEE